MSIKSNIPPATEEKDLRMSNPAWADAMSKILKTKKQKGKPLVLSKAKIISEINVNKIKQENKDTDEAFEVVDKGGKKVIVSINDVKDEKPDLENIEHKIPKRIRVCNDCFEFFNNH